MSITVALLALAACAHEPPAAPAPAASARAGHVEVDGVSYAWRITGHGEPLLLLHGGLGSMDMFDPLLPALEQGHEVIAVDLQGHGRSTLGERPIRLTDMG